MQQVHRDTRPKRPLAPILTLLQKMFPSLSGRLKRKYWEKAWIDEQQSPETLSTALPSEIQQAVSDDWLKAGCSVLDIGCGRGQISAWLAEQGYEVVGGELADAAVELARQHFGDVGKNLSYRQLDICAAEPEPGRFDAAVDRGCFHGIPDNLKAKYVDNVALWLRKNGRLLMLTKIDGSQSETEQRIDRLFSSKFKILRSEPTLEPLTRSAGPYPRVQAPGLAVWMERK